MVSRKVEIAQVHGRRIRPKLSESACYSVACNFCATQARARQFNVTLYVADPSQMRRGILSHFNSCRRTSQQGWIVFRKQVGRFDAKLELMYPVMVQDGQTSSDLVFCKVLEQHNTPALRSK